MLNLESRKIAEVINWKFFRNIYLVHPRFWWTHLFKNLLIFQDLLEENQADCKKRIQYFKKAIIVFRKKLCISSHLLIKNRGKRKWKIQICENKFSSSQYTCVLSRQRVKEKWASISWTIEAILTPIWYLS